MATLTLTDVRKSFGKTEVIHGIDIDIAEGEFIVIVGPSGCGKSTLLRMVAGLETVTAGEIGIDGKVVNGMEPMDRDIAMVFQNYALYPHMSVFDNMAYGLKIAKTPKAEIEARVAQAAKMLQLEPYLRRKPRELSGGQRQRVAMGRAIVREPAVFLFDEPLSNLDAKLRVQMRLEIKALQKQLGITSLYVTHDQVEAMTMSDRVALLQEGRLLQVGPPAALYGDPASADVARFIGSPEVNLLPVRAAAGALQLAGQALPVASGQAEGTDLMLGIRPEAIRLADASTAGGCFGLQVVRRAVEDLGGELVVHGSLAHAPDIPLRLRLQKAPDGSAPIPVPDTFAAEVPMGAVLLFAADGQRVAGPAVMARAEIPA